MSVKIQQTNPNPVGALVGASGTKYPVTVNTSTNVATAVVTAPGDASAFLDAGWVPSL